MVAIKHSSDLFWNSNDSRSILLLVSVRSVESMQSLAPSIVNAERVTIVAIITISHRDYLSLVRFFEPHLSHDLSGFFIRTSLIPVFLRWAQYLCALKYAINLVLLTEFNLDNDSCQGAAAFNCKAIIANNNIVGGDTFIYILLLFALFVVFRGIGMFILVQKAKRFC